MTAAEPVGTESALERGVHVQFARRPFRHCIVTDPISPGLADKFLSWLRDEAEWVLQESFFYEQFSSKRLDDLSKEQCPLISDLKYLEKVLRERLEVMFGIETDSQRSYISAHQLVRGQEIGPHTDDPRGGTEDYRFVLHLNERYDADAGGHLVLFSPDEPEKSLVVLAPLHNTGVYLEFSPISWHFVEEVKGGRRFTLLFSFWRNAPPSRAMEEVQAEEVLIRYLRKYGADEIPHSNRSLLDHLCGTRDILVRWGGDSMVCQSGLLHSVFGRVGVLPLLSEGNARKDLEGIVDKSVLDVINAFQSLTTQTLLGRLNSVAGRPDPLLISLLLLVFANSLDQWQYETKDCTHLDLLYDLFKVAAEWLPAPALRDCKHLLFFNHI